MFEENQSTDQVTDKETSAETKDTGTDLAKIMKRLDDKDNFIQKLIEERRQDEERIKALEAKAEANAKNAEFTKKVVEEPVETPQETPLDVEGKVKELLDQRFQQESQKGNLKSFEEFMINSYGSASQAKKVFEDKAQKLGYSSEQLQEMVATQPQLVKELFRVQPGQAKSANPDQGTIQQTVMNTNDAADELSAMRAELRKDPNIAAKKPGWQKRYQELYLASRKV